METSENDTGVVDAGSVESTTDVAKEESVTRPEYLPEQYWDSEKGQANIEELANDLKKYRVALSHKGQDVLDDPSGYTFENIKLPDGLKGDVQAFVHELGLSKYQAEQLFSGAGDKLGQKLNEYYRSEQTQEDEVAERAYIEQEVESFGGADKVKEAVKRMDNMFIVAKNKGLLDDEEVAAFKHNAIRDAGTLKIFDKLVGLFDSLTSRSTINTAESRSSMDNGYNNLNREELIDKISAQLRKAHTRAEREKIYNSLANLS